MRYTLLIPLLAGTIAFPLEQLPAQSSPEVMYTTETRTELGGRLGRMLRLFGGGGAVTETYWFSGPRMRSDRDRRSTIMDAREGTIVELQHQPRTYWMWSVDEPLLVFEWGDEVDDALDEYEEFERPAARRPRTRYEVTLSTERSGNRRQIAGLDTEQTFMTLTITGETYNEAADSIERGTLVVLSELWLTDHFPGAAAQEAFHHAWTERSIPMLDSAQIAQAQRAMDLIYAEEPRIQVAMQRLDSAMANLSGEPLRTVSHFVVVPDGARFDREAVLRDADRTLAADVAEGAARGAADAGRRRIGRIAGGRLGGGDREPRPEQAVIMRTRYEVTALSTASIPADKFQVPADYRRRTPGDGAR